MIEQTNTDESLSLSLSFFLDTVDVMNDILLVEMCRVYNIYIYMECMSSINVPLCVCCVLLWYRFHGYGCV